MNQPVRAGLAGWWEVGGEGLDRITPTSAEIGQMSIRSDKHGSNPLWLFALRSHLKKDIIFIRFSTIFESGLNQIRKCQIQLVLFTLSEANHIWVTFERKNRIQVTFNCSVNVA